MPALVSSVQYRRTLVKLSVSLLESVPKGRDLGSADIRYHVLSSCRSQCPYRKVDIAEQRAITLLSFPVRYHIPRSSLPVTLRPGTERFYRTVAYRISISSLAVTTITPNSILQRTTFDLQRSTRFSMRRITRRIYRYIIEPHVTQETPNMERATQTCETCDKAWQIL